MSRIRPWTNGDQVALDGAGNVPVVVDSTTPIDVTGPLTDTELRTSPIDVIGPLTDTELRASQVPVDSRLVDELGVPYGIKHVNNQPRVVAKPYYVAIAEDNIPSHTPIYKFGSNQSAGTTEATIWSEGIVYPWDAIDLAVGIVKLSSTSASDTAAGTGARTATIYGLSLAGLEQNETLTLNGQTPVNSTLSYNRVFMIICRTAGTARKNAGVIRVGTGTVTAGVPAVIWARVNAGDNQTLQCVYTVPTGATLYMVAAEYSVNGNKGADGRIYTRPPGELFQIKDIFHMAGGIEPHEYHMPRKFESGTDIDFRAIAGQAGTDIAANFTGWYE